VSQHHGILLHADQVDDLAELLTTTEHWLLNATSNVHLNLHQFLTTTRPDPTRQLLLDQVEDLIHRLTTTSQDWPHHADDSPDAPDPHPTTPHPPDPVDQFLEQLAATAALITHAGHDPRLARTPC
jgi:CHAD domain-containing protein